MQRQRGRGGIRVSRPRVDAQARNVTFLPPPPAFQLPPYFAQAPQGYNALPYATASMASGWTAVSGGSVVVSSVHAYDGTASLAVTCSSTTTVVQCAAAHVWPGVTYYPQIQAYGLVSGCTVAIEVDYLDVPGTVLASFTGAAFPVRYDGSWGVILGPICAPPAGAASGRLKMTIASPGGTTVYLDAAYLGACQDPPNFTSNTYISFDPQTTVSPAWTDATPFVEIDTNSIAIQHGRQDGLSDVNTGTLAFTADDSDGRWFDTNTGGAWYGGIRKGAWIKQTVSFGGVEYSRFVGFITSLPLAGLGAYTTSQVQGSDWLSRLGQASILNTAIWHETLADPYGVPAPWAYYALSEKAASTAGTASAGTSTSANDSSGYASQLGMPFPLTPRPVNAGGGAINWANTTAPGFDSDQSIGFAPASTSSGFTLRGQLARSLGASWLLRYWISTTTKNQTALTIADYSGGVAAELICGVDSNGFFSASVSPTSASSPYQPGSGLGAATTGPNLADGSWHLVSIYGSPSSTPGSTHLYVTVDGVFSLAWDLPVPTTMQVLTVGGQDDQLRLGPGNVALFTGSLYGLSITDMTGWATPGTDPTQSTRNVLAAASTGFAGETTGARLTRIARYAGVPSAWCDFDTGVSLVGQQSYLGRYPLDVLREASRTEAMPLWCATSGKITFRQRTIRFNPAAAFTLQAADLDPSTTAANDYSYIINQAQVTRVGGSQITVQGSRGIASQTKYGLYYTTQQTASYSDVDVSNLAGWLILTTADPPPRMLPAAEVATLAATPSPLAVSAGWGSALYQAVLTADLSSMFTLANLPAQVGGGNLNQIIEGWAETITAATHTFTWNTTYPAAAGIFQLDTSPYNQLDAGYIIAY
jgi:hypothetical protein